jgi:hypothetical protein
LTLREQVIEEPSQADQAPAQAFIDEAEQQAITAGGDVKPTGGVDVGAAQEGTSSGGGRTSTKRLAQDHADLA